MAIFERGGARDYRDALVGAGFLRLATAEGGSMSKVRCAIYTRKSSEEGLEQDFNSLHAQREACAAYILSQASEGWSLIPTAYDDGGLSGGTLERPALRRLLKDIERGRIDIVVVYKVDRLTRSLLDFARLVEAMDRAKVSFVSITQSFNTTTSMGRLTLNMLLSFAQFEREVTAERIRDKIAASKAKGMWMGGVPPLGYAPDGRSLKIIEPEAALIRDIFVRYLALGNVRLVTEQLAEQSILIPRRSFSTGRTFGGRPFSRGQIYRMLSNPVYIGEIAHKGRTYPGRHDAIIDRETWDLVQQQLTDNKQGEETSARAQSPSLLRGLIFDDHGQPLIASYACKGNRRYRYYVSRITESAEETIRIPAREVEAAVIQRIQQSLDKPITLLSDVGLPLEAGRLKSITRSCEKLAEQLTDKAGVVLRELVDRIVVTPKDIRIEISTSRLATRLGYDSVENLAPIDLVAPVRLTRSGLAMRLIQSDGRTVIHPIVDAGLIRLLIRARDWWRRIETGETNIATIARDEGVNDSWVSRVIRLNFLAPSIVDAIVTGTQPTTITAASLRSADIPIAWEDQVAFFKMA